MTVKDSTDTFEEMGRPMVMVRMLVALLMVFCLSVPSRLNGRAWRRGHVFGIRHGGLGSRILAPREFVHRTSRDRFPRWSEG